MSILLEGQTLTLKKTHPCGGKSWQVVRSGADTKIKCLTCGRVVMIDTQMLLKQCKVNNEANHEE